MKKLLLVIAFSSFSIGLTGCGFLRSESQEQTHAVTKIQGTFDGKAVALTTETVQTSQSESKTEIDTKDFWSIFSAILQSFGGGTGIMAMILAWREKSRADSHQADADNAGKTWMPIPAKV